MGNPRKRRLARKIGLDKADKARAAEIARVEVERLKKEAQMKAEIEAKAKAEKEAKAAELKARKEAEKAEKKRLAELEKTQKKVTEDKDLPNSLPIQ